LFSLKTKYLVETFLATTFKEITNFDDEYGNVRQNVCFRNLK